MRKENCCSTCDICYQNYFVNTYNGQNAISLLHPERNWMMNLWQGLTEELSKDGACERAIFPDTSVVVTRCTMIGNLNVEGGDRCNLNLVLGCTDPSSPSYDPLANVDDGSCPIELDSDS
ncbi:uncharacterized protein Pyn_03198 [Prunus yedoensis var. nudiflora]|uniref:Uncharacterized protein n=1 Tax=Prunus yedoensis var. nudiflora TaxID=2094558 RepID=A0A314ZFA8_PRUYE|nr:uncharacterized protein Pyn_03198 [Prunus yedoensis var. nudiflora]